MFYRALHRRPIRTLAPRALAAATLVVAAVGLSGCVSGSALYTGPASTTSAASAPTVTTGATNAPLPPISRSKPAAIVAGQTISGADYADAANQARQYYSQQAAQQPGSPLPSETQIRSAALNSLIDRAVVDHYAGQHGITATQAEVQQRYNAYQLQAGGAITFTREIKNAGLTEASLRRSIADGILQSKVQAKVAPTPTQLTEVRARHILVRTKALADSIYAQLQKNPSLFVSLAKKYSIDTGSAPNGGELGYLAHGATVPPFDQAIFSLKQGQISMPVKSQYGYHIIQVEGRKTVAYKSLDPQTQQAVTTYAFRKWLLNQRAQDTVRILVPGVTLSTS